MSPFSVSKHLITIISLIIQTVNGQDCGTGVPTVATSLCFDYPPNNRCSGLDDCRARAEFKPLPNLAEGIEVRLIGAIFQGQQKWIRLHIYLQQTDNEYFNLYCDRTKAEHSISGKVTDIAINEKPSSESSLLHYCNFEVTPTVAKALRTATSFDPINEHYLQLDVGDVNSAQDRFTRVSTKAYIFQSDFDVTVATARPGRTTRTTIGNGPVRTTAGGNGPQTPGTGTGVTSGSDDTTDSKPLASGATKSSSTVWIIVGVVILLVIVVAGSIAYLTKKNKKSSRSRVAPRR